MGSLGQPASSHTPRTVGDLLDECLRSLGARRVFGDALPVGHGVNGRLAHVAIADPALARMLADADGRLGPGPGLAWDADRRVLRLSSQPGVEIDPWVLDDPVRLPAALGTWTIGEVHAASEYRLELDLDEPVPDELEPVILDTPVSMYTLNPSLAEIPSIVLAGPGVVREGQVEQLRVFAAMAGVGVLNTWGAKGVFVWDSPHHLGTAGLQERDFELGGLGDAELIIAVGLDADESPRERWEAIGGGQVLDVEPASLAALAFGWDPPERAPQRPRLYTELSAALAPHYASDAVPLHPARAAGDLAAVRRPGMLVAADPGPAGLWVARAFPTTEAGSVVVPARPAPGFAVAAAIVAAIDDRASIAVMTDPVDAQTVALLEWADSLGLPLVLEVWGADATLGSVADHADELRAALDRPGVDVIPVPVDFGQTQLLVDVAGPVVAWHGER